MKENRAPGQKENIRINLRKNIKNQAGMLCLNFFHQAGSTKDVHGVILRISDPSSAIGASWPLGVASNALIYKIWACFKVNSTYLRAGIILLL